jgi:hypothetical protein
MAEQAEPAPEHVPATVRNAFLELLDGEPAGEAACQLAAQLLGCIDVLPQEYGDVLGLPPGSTFAQAAAALRAELGCA